MCLSGYLFLSLVERIDNVLVSIKITEIETPGSIDVDVPSKKKRKEDDTKKDEAKRVRKFHPA